MRFARGFLRNFTTVLIAYLAYLKWNNDQVFLAILLFIGAILVGVFNYKLSQKEQRGNPPKSE